MQKTEAKNLKIYFIFSYLIFWLLLGLTGYLISIDIPLTAQTVIKNICAWTPTFVVLIMFKKLYPGITLKEYLKAHFTKKIKPADFLSSFLLQAGVLAAAVLAYFIVSKKPLNTMSFIASSSILPVLVIDLTSGPLGEELGWRGYALNILQKKYVPLTAGIILGVVWGLWHLPLMILSGYSGADLVYYMIAFMTAVISFSIVITYFYNKSKNIFIAIWIHFWFNFLLKVVIIDLLPLLICVAAGYLAAAVFIVVLKKKNMLEREASAAS